MSNRYKIHDSNTPHFITSTVIYWMDALSRPQYKDILTGSFKYAIDNKGFQLHAWVIMSNHFHIIASASDGHSLPGIIRDIKKFTSKKIVNAIIANPQESRKEWLVRAFTNAGEHAASNDQYQFWQPDYHPVALSTEDVFMQKLHYIHDNPVRAGLVWQAEDYVYSSAGDWNNGKQGLLPLLVR